VVLACAPGPQHAGIHQDLEVVRDGGLREVEVRAQLAARELADRGDGLHHAEAPLVGERLEYPDCLCLFHLEGWMPRKPIRSNGSSITRPLPLPFQLWARPQFMQAQMSRPPMPWPPLSDQVSSAYASHFSQICTRSAILTSLRVRSDRVRIYQPDTYGANLASVRAPGH
jgi:hypothetical protein